MLSITVTGSNRSSLALAAYPVVRCRRWSVYVHRTPPEVEVKSIRRAGATGLPYGDASWVNRPATRLKLDLTIRPRGRPKKTAKLLIHNCRTYWKWGSAYNADFDNLEQTLFNFVENIKGRKRGAGDVVSRHLLATISPYR